MIPDYETAARKAVDTVIRYKVNPGYTDPLYILKKLPNVRLISYDISDNRISISKCIDPAMIGDNQDAMTLTGKKNGETQYIVIYNQNLQPTQFRFALARELGHIILKHDGSMPEHVRMEEANCFAHHFLCPLPLTYPVEVRKAKPINYRPLRESLLWEMKEIRTFDSLDAMKAFVVDEYNKLCRYSGTTSKIFSTFDVELSGYKEQERITGWKNFYNIVLNGRTIGFCGE